MKKVISLILSLSIILTAFINAFAIDSNKILNMANDTASYLYETIKNPQTGSMGGEWTILGLARSEAKIPQEYYERYYKNVENYVKECGGILHKRKYTEYARVVLAYSAIGKNPQNVAGYDLLKPLTDYEKTIWQGINGAIFAVLALDNINYEISQNTQLSLQRTKEKYINRILELQLPDGGWSLSSKGKQISDPDITGMALQALAKHKDDIKVAEAIEKAILCLSSLQNEDGGFTSFGDKTCESTVQVIVALCELGISIDDERFVKNGKTLLDSLERFYIQGKGFSHIPGGETDLMSTEQGMCALAALKRNLEGKSSFYNIGEAKNPKGSLASIYIKSISILNDLLCGDK